MNVNLVSSAHDATASAMGFRYQERFALLELLDVKDEEATVAIEALDDVQLTANGTDLLKHSFAAQPKPIDIKSANLWTTLRIWAELLPSIDISSTSFALITVAPLSQNSLLECLQTMGSDRSGLLTALVAEAAQVGLVDRAKEVALGEFVLKDVDYVKDLLTTDYPTERSHAITHPPLDQVILSATFDYSAGTVEGEVPNGETSREGNPYLWFKHSDKSILSHRFISAVTLGKWVPRECYIDHINNNPSDNRPTNLRITTPRDNAGNRRKALLSELVEIEGVAVRLEEIKAVPEPEPPLKSAPETDELNDKMHIRRPEHGALPKYTGDSKPGNSSGIYFGTTFDSWHWYPDGTAPDAKDFVEDL